MNLEWALAFELPITKGTLQVLQTDKMGELIFFNAVYKLYYDIITLILLLKTYTFIPYYNTHSNKE